VAKVSGSESVGQTFSQQIVAIKGLSFAQVLFDGVVAIRG